MLDYWHSLQGDYRSNEGDQGRICMGTSCYGLQDQPNYWFLGPHVSLTEHINKICLFLIASLHRSTNFYNTRPASRAFLHLTRNKELCRNRVKPFLNMCKLLLGDTFKPKPSLDRTPRRHVDFDLRLVKNKMCMFPKLA